MAIAKPHYPDRTAVCVFQSAITGIGTYVPEQKVTNDDLEKLVETSDEWIVQRTGIRERRKAAADEFTTDLCEAAVKDLVRRYGVTLDDVDMILVATTTPDYGFPSCASQLQARFGIPSAGAMDINATCAGFVSALHLADGLIRSGLHRKVMVVGGETLTRITDYTDRTTCILFGDGAGAVLVERTESADGILGSLVGTEGAGGGHVYRTGLSKRMGDRELGDSGCIVQNGREVFKWAVTTVSAGMMELLQRNGLSHEQVDWVIPHSANLRILEAISERTNIPMEKFLYSLEYYGNTSAASIPLALDLGIKDGKVKHGDRILLYGFGGGLVQAGMLASWQG